MLKYDETEQLHNSIIKVKITVERDRLSTECPTHYSLTLNIGAQ